MVSECVVLFFCFVEKESFLFCFVCFFVVWLIDWLIGCVFVSITQNQHLERML